MQIAAKEAKDVSGHFDIPVAIDVLSRFCKCPNKMHNENYSGTVENSGSIEVSGAIEIFQRSESLHDLRYTKFLGDGDSRAYKTVNEMQPYGDKGMEKVEYAGYAKKRMGTQLRALKLKMKVLGLNSNKFLIQAFADDLAVVTTGMARRTKEIETNSILDQISNKLKNLKLVISPENTYSVAFRYHFAEVATANGVEVSVPAPCSYVFKTLQNKLRTGRVGGQTLLLVYESNPGPSPVNPKPSLDINPHSSYVTQFLTNHGQFVSYSHRFKLKTTPNCFCGLLGTLTIMCLHVL
ncbi:hypothetical protein TNCV_2823241 [Trichonephila clavipes]|nr:hypothetical protein TNCV_2823241 [Trichonephila clavipes]